ncbi:MAG: TM2 domain-containing protein [Phycisphaerales bacterium]|nr:MAG: TM2 domain-containing protein [Phycisphaerales bacterium]
MPGEPDTHPKHEHPPTGFKPLAGLLACALPGLGHLYLGQTRRALAIGAGVLGLFFLGVFIGGIDSVDRREDPLWFLGQAVVGPVAFITDRVHQQHFKVVDDGWLRSAWPHEAREPDASPRLVDPTNPADRPPSVKGVAKTNELGTLFTTLAGFLNLIVILDALMPPLHRLREGRA